jgi:hypothetical protein
MIQLGSIVLSALLLPGNIFAAPQSARLDTLAGELSNQISIKASWSVLEGFLDAQLDSDIHQGFDSAALRRLMGGHAFSDLDNPKKVEQFISSLRKSGVAYSTAALVKTGLPPSIAIEISERMPREYLFQMERALLAYSSVAGMRPQDVGEALKIAVRQSSTPLLARRDMKSSDFKSIAAMIKATTSADNARQAGESGYLNVVYSQNHESASQSQLEQRFVQGTLEPTLIKNKDLTKEMLKYLSEEAKNQYAALIDIKQKEAFLDSLAEDFVSRASTATVQVGVKQFSVPEGVQVLTTVGQFQTLERNTAKQVSQGAERLGAGLEAARQILESNWKDQVEAARQITGLDSLPASAVQLASTSHLVNDLASFASGGHLSRSTEIELAGMISSQVPAAKDVVNLSMGIEQIASGQSSFAQQGQVLLGALASITKSPVLGQVQSAFSSFAPVLQAAGPLLAMAGLASPLGGISMVGGLLGGGGGLMGGRGDGETQAMLQAISQKLEVMDHKLDVIMQNLDALDRKITEEHVEVMNALESISFDINRTLELIRSAEVKNFSRACEAIPSMIDDGQFSPSQIEATFRSCYEKLSTVSLDPASPEQFFRAIPHLKTENLNDTAFNKLQAIAKIYAKTGDSAQSSCFSLVLAAYSVHDLDKIGNVGLAQARKPPEQALCNNVLSFGNMIHSGTITFFSSLEQSAADHSKALTQRGSAASVWSDDSRRVLLYRWNNELRLLNIAIGQQARLTGDFTTPQWAEKLELVNPLDPIDQTVLDQSEILAQNSLRYWLAKHRSVTAAYVQNARDHRGPTVSSSLQFAFAYAGCAPNYLRSLTEFGPHGPADFEKVHFNWTSDILDQSQNAQSLRIDDPASPPRPCPTRDKGIHRWCALFDGLKNCITLPNSDEMITGELRRSDNLEALLDARVKILTLIETTNFITSLKHDDRIRLVEGLAMKWAVDRNRIENANRNGDETAARNLQMTTALN